MDTLNNQEEEEDVIEEGTQLPDVLPPEGHDEEEEEAKIEEPASEEKEEEEKPKKRDGTAKRRISELVKRGHQYEDRIRELEQANFQIEQQLSQANQAATRHFDDSVSLQLDRAKQLKRAALESGDIDAITEADVAIASAASAMQQAQILKQRQKQYEEESEQYQEEEEVQAPTNEYQRELNNFASQNSWYYPDSADYDAELSGRLRKEVDNFEARLRSMGQGNLIGKRPYFQEIERYIASELLPEYEAAPPPPKREVRMKPQSYSATAPGRTSGRLPLQKETRKLTSDQRYMGRKMGKTDEEIMKAIIETEIEQGIRRR